MDHNPTSDSGQSRETPTADLFVRLRTPVMLEQDSIRRPRAVVSLVFRPPDGAAEVQGASFTFTAPIGPMEADELAWYLEKWARWPSEHFRRRAGRVEAALADWGRSLWTCLDTQAAHQPLKAWRKAPRRGWERQLTIEVDDHGEVSSGAVEAATRLLALPWELLHDGQGHLLHEQDRVRIRRRPSKKALAPTPAPTEPPIRVLLVSPRPDDDRVEYFDHRISARPLVEALESLGNLAELDLLEPPTLRSLRERLQQRARQGRPYHIVHFDGHGSFDRQLGEGVLYFEQPLDDDELWFRLGARVTGRELAEGLRAHGVSVVFLEACQSALSDERPDTSVAAQLLQGGVSSVVAMTHSVLIETTRRFVASFYRELMAGQPVAAAVLAGQRELAAERFRRKTFAGDLTLDDWFVPILFQSEQDPRLIERVTSEGIQRVVAEQPTAVLSALPAEPNHRFLGRSREILALERWFLHESYAVVLGEGGEGKTTLACELARWLVATNRASRVVFVSLEIDFTPIQVLRAIGLQLVRDFILIDAQQLEQGIKRLEEKLHEQKTIFVIDNFESVLPGPENDALYEPEMLQELLSLFERSMRAGQTKLLFTSRAALPPPFGRTIIELGRLDADSAIELVGRVLAEEGKKAEVGHRYDSEWDGVAALVESAGRHARSLVLLAGEIARQGVKAATVDLNELMSSLAERFPNDRERSLFASVELSLRRLPAKTRAQIEPLGVFHRGGCLSCIAQVLQLGRAEVFETARWLKDVGLAQDLGDQYFSFHPGLAPYLAQLLSDQELGRLRERWAEAVTRLIYFLYRQQDKDVGLAARLTLHELPNLLAGLDYLHDEAEPAEVMDIVSRLERLVAPLGRSRVLKRVVKVRRLVAELASGWDHARFAAEQARIGRLLRSGHIEEAVASATTLVTRFDAVGDSLPEANYYQAHARLLLGDALWAAGRAEAALAPLKGARRVFEELVVTGNPTAEGMALVCMTVTAGCLRSLGRLDEAANQYKEVIAQTRARGDRRDLAVAQGGLGTTRLQQGRLDEALAAHRRGRDEFEALGEPLSVAGAWHQIGRVHQEAGRYAESEQAFQRSLEIKGRVGTPADEASTLNQLGRLYFRMDRLEDAVRFHRFAADVYNEIQDVTNEGKARTGLALVFEKLGRFDEARREIGAAVAFNSQSGASAEPWKSFEILRRIERAAGNADAAEAARRRAIESYGEYRRSGGVEKSIGGRLCFFVAQAVAGGEVEEARKALNRIRERPDLPDNYHAAFLPALEALLAGDRDPTLADDPRLHYADAAELRLLLARLAATEISESD